MRERLQEIRERLDGAGGDSPAMVSAADVAWLLAEIDRLTTGLQRIANHRGDSTEDRGVSPCAECSAVRVYARSLLRGTDSTVSLD